MEARLYQFPGALSPAPCDTPPRRHAADVITMRQLRRLRNRRLSAETDAEIRRAGAVAMRAIIARWEA